MLRTNRAHQNFPSALTMTSAEHTPVGKSLPRRAAAKKASKLAAEQLDSSGDEFEEGTSKTPLRRKQPQAKSIQKKKSSVTLPSKDCTPKPDVRRVSPPKTVLALASDSGSDLEELGVLPLLVKTFSSIHSQKRDTVYSSWKTIQSTETSQVIVTRSTEYRVYRRTTWRPKPFVLSVAICKICCSQECKSVSL